MSEKLKERIGLTLLLIGIIAYFFVTFSVLDVTSLFGLSAEMTRTIQVLLALCPGFALGVFIISIVTRSFKSD